jgi:hypothetical protein
LAVHVTQNFILELVLEIGPMGYFRDDPFPDSTFGASILEESK